MCNSVGYDITDMNHLNDIICEGINGKCIKPGMCCNHVSCVSVDDIRDSVMSLKANKRDCMANLYTDHLINGNSRLFALLSILYTAIIKHGYCPDVMLNGVMTPIPKVSGTTSSENFRAITSCSTMCKLFEVIVQKKCENVFKTSDLQFGFKPNSSTADCTFVVQEIISFYNDPKTDVYCTLLDSSKAFDRLEFCTLFHKLLNRKMCPLMVRILLYMYVNQSLAVKWNGYMSASFKVSNGVKQGGIISPVLYCVYINDLLELLKYKDIGCHIGPTFYGALGYADDLILMAPSVQGTKDMLKECQKYAVSHKIKFNGSKSQVIIFTNKRNITRKPLLYINDEKISIVSQVKYLGHMLSDSNPDIIDLAYVKNCFNKSVNIMMATLGSISSNVLGKLFTNYCCSLYGVTLCNLRSAALLHLNVAWRKAVRRIYKLPNRTHNILLPFILERPDCDIDIHCRVLKFYLSLLNSPNNIVQVLANRCHYQSISNMGKNVSLFFVRYGLNYADFTFCDVSQLKIHVDNVNSEIVENIIVIKELINIRDGICLSPLSTSECGELLNLLCTCDM